LSRQRTRGRRQHEPDHPDPEQPAPTVDIAQSTAGDQQCREGQRVRSAVPLDIGRRPTEVGVDHRCGDLDDRRVEQVHRLGDQEGDQPHPFAHHCLQSVGGSTVADRPIRFQLDG